MATTRLCKASGEFHTGSGRLLPGLKSLPFVLCFPVTTSYRVGYWLMLLKRRSLLRYHPNVRYCRTLHWHDQ